MLFIHTDLSLDDGKCDVKGTVHSKMTFQSFHPHNIPNSYDFLFIIEHKRRHGRILFSVQ